MTFEIQDSSFSSKPEQQIISTDHVIELSNDKTANISSDNLKFIQNLAKTIKAKYRKKLWVMCFILMLLVFAGILCFQWKSISGDDASTPGKFILAAAFVLAIVLLVNWFEYYICWREVFKMNDN